MPLVRCSSRRGCRVAMVAPLVALLLVPILGVTALALDGGMLMDSKRRVQAAADAAALAGAVDLYTHYPTFSSTGIVPASTYTSITTTAAANGCSGSNYTVTPNVSSTGTPTNYKGGNHKDANGNFKPMPTGYVEVIIVYQQKAAFAGIFGMAQIPVTGRAVARGSWKTSGNGVVALNPTALDALFVHGGATLNANGSNAYVNSNNINGASVDSGTGSTITVGTLNVTGTQSGPVNGTVVTGTPPIPDPLASVPVPAVPSTIGTLTTVNLAGGAQTTTLTPGYYSSTFTPALTFAGQTNVVLQPGQYYFDQPFSVTGQGSFTANGVFIYSNYQDPTPLTPTTYALTIAWQGTINMSPMTTGVYQGISYFQNRTSTAMIKVQGNGLANITGTFYAASAAAQFQGNGAASIASQVVVSTLDVGGNGAANINFNAPGAPGERVMQLVE